MRLKNFSELNNMEIKNRNISELKSADYNPRKISDKELEDLKKSITNLDILEPVVVNTFPGRENIIISGHQRVKAAKELGLSVFPCYEVSFDLKKEKEANVRLNKNTGGWDMDKLATNFELEDLTNWGFEDNFFPDFEDDLPEFNVDSDEKNSGSFTCFKKDVTAIKSELELLKGKYEGFQYYCI